MTTIDNTKPVTPTPDDEPDFMARKSGRPSKREEMLKAKFERIKQNSASADFGEQKLPVKPIDGFELRWVNDRDNRIERFIERGWVFIDKDGAQPLNEETKASVDKAKYIVVGSKKDGSPLHAYLMGIETEIFEWAQRKKQSVNDRIMSDIQRNLPGSGAGENNEHSHLKQSEITANS